MRVLASKATMRKWTAAAVASLVLYAAAAGSLAQTTPPPDEAQLRTEADVLFKRMLVKPNDLDATFRYAEIETKLGEYEAAIGALERMLFYNQNLPRVKLELGLLYFRLRSYETARSYFNAAVASPDTPQDVRDRVATFLAAIDRGVSDNQFAFFAQMGMRYQTNANAGPSSQLVLALGQDAVLSSQFRRTPDWNVFALSSLHHFYDFDNQRGDGWESDLTLYYAKQFKVNRLDLALGELATGPRVGIGNGTGMSIHPYALVNDVALGNAQYLGTIGGGASVRFQLPLGAIVDSGVEYRSRDFSNSSDYPNATLQTGHLWTGYVVGSGPLSAVSGLSWQARISYSHDEARYKPYAYDEFAVDFALPYSFTAPGFSQATHDWTIAPFVGYSTIPYDRPDLIVDPFRTRHDRQWRVGTTVDMTFYKNIGFAVTFQYFQTNSTVPNYRNRDFIVSGGPTIRF